MIALVALLASILATAALLHASAPAWSVGVGAAVCVGLGFVVGVRGMGGRVE